MIHTETVRDQSIAASESQKVERWFYIGTALLMIAISVAGFAPSIVEPANRKVPLPLTPVVMTHAIAASTWLLFFLLQSWLAATKRIARHRSLGVIGVLLAILIAVSGWMTVMQEARRGFDLSGDLSPPGTSTNAADFLPALIGIVLFMILVTAAILFRQRAEVHKRLIVLATLGGLSSAPLIHLINHQPTLRPNFLPLFTACYFILLTLQPIYDRISRRRIHPVSLWGGLAVLVAFHGFFIFVVPSAPWHSFAEWVVLLR